MPDKTTPLEDARAEIREVLDALGDDRNFTADEDPADWATAALAPIIDEIIRQAKAQALREQAKILGKRRAALLMKSADPVFIGSPMAATYRDMSQQAGADAGMLYRAADDVIAEGWEHTCAATRPATWEDPAEGCETPVEHEGDYCPRHEPADDWNEE
jgi:hypothetical protein